MSRSLIYLAKNVLILTGNGFPWSQVGSFRATASSWYVDMMFLTHGTRYWSWTHYHQGLFYGYWHITLPQKCGGHSVRLIVLNVLEVCSSKGRDWSVLWCAISQFMILPFFFLFFIYNGINWMLPWDLEKKALAHLGLYKPTILKSASHLLMHF